MLSGSLLSSILLDFKTLAPQALSLPSPSINVNMEGVSIPNFTDMSIHVCDSVEVTVSLAHCASFSCTFCESNGAAGSTGGPFRKFSVAFPAASLFVFMHCCRKYTIELIGFVWELCATGRDKHSSAACTDASICSFFIQDNR